MRAVRWRLVGGSGLVAVYVLFALFHAWHYVCVLGEQRYYRSDVLHLYTAAQIVADGQGSHLYDFELQRRYQATIPHPFTDLLPFNHPPYTAVLIAPLARFPFLIMYLVFSLGQFAAYGLAIWVLRPWWGRWSRIEQAFFLIIASTFVCVFQAIHWGNPALFAFLFVVLAFKNCYHNDSSPSSGIWLALSTIKPHTVIGLFWSLACGRRLRPLGGAMVTLTALIGLAIAVVGSGGTLDFGRAVLSTYRAGEDGRFNIKPEDMPNLRGLLAFTGLSHAAVTIGTLAFIVAVAFFLLWLWWPRPSTTAPSHESVRWALTVPLVVLASPHLYSQDVSLAVFSGMLLYDWARNRSDHRRLVGGFVLVAPIASQICFFAAGSLARPPVWAACNAIILIGLAILALVVTAGAICPRSRERGRPPA